MAYQHTIASTARRILACLALAALLTGVAGCGGSSGPAGGIVARVGPTAITRTELNQWMSTLAGGDYNEVARGHVVPAGLVSEPANYAACVASLQAAEAAHAGHAPASNAAPPQTSAQLLAKCHLLYQVVRRQAIAYLIEAQWTISIAAEEGLTATNTEITNELNKYATREYGSTEAFDQYLAHARRTLAEERLIVQLDILSNKLQQKVSNGGKQATTELTEAAQRWSAKTQCAPGYVVRHCAQYASNTPAPTTPSAAILMEQVATITGIPCVNNRACG